MDESEQNRSEQPTPYKLSRARKKGNVARGADLGFFTTVAVFGGYMWSQGATLGEKLSDATRAALVSAPGISSGTNEMMQFTGHIFAMTARPLALLAVAIFLIVLLLELLQTGVVFTGQPLKPDFSKLNPAKGLKRIFSLRMLLETAKNVLKLGVYTAITWLVIRRAIPEAAIAGDAATLAGVMLTTGLWLIASFAVAALFFAALDQIIVRKEFLKKMRMSTRELRRELREREGEPRMKQRRKQLHAEFVKASESLRNVRGADIIVTNPVHLAVALRYKASEMSAPVVVSKGANALAQRIKKLAFMYGVVIVEDKELARSLFRRCDINSPVPEADYRSVAKLYHSLNRKSF